MSNVVKTIGSIDLNKFRLLKNDLFPVYESPRGEKIVNLRDVYEALKVKKSFTKWAEMKMDEMGFRPDVDFVKKYLQVQIKKSGRQRIEYIVPLRNAKKLAMGVNSEDADFVKDYFLACEEIAVSVTASLEPAPLNLLDFTNQNVQVQCVRRVASYLMPTTNPSFAIDHFRETCKLLTGLRPSAYRKAYVLAGNRVKSLSGRQLMRRFEPAKACAAAFLDDARQRGRDVAQLAQAGVVDAITPAFDALLKAGYTMQELGG